MGLISCLMSLKSCQADLAFILARLDFLAYQPYKVKDSFWIAKTFGLSADILTSHSEYVVLVQGKRFCHHETAGRGQKVRTAR